MCFKRHFKHIEGSLGLVLGGEGTIKVGRRDGAGEMAQCVKFSPHKHVDRCCLPMPAPPKALQFTQHPVTLCTPRLPGLPSSLSHTVPSRAKLSPKFESNYQGSLQTWLPLSGHSLAS